MAEGTMANYTSSILFQPPRSEIGIQAFLVDGASEVKAGYALTMSGLTAYDCAKPDADADFFLGCALERPEIPLDDYFDDNTPIMAALAGSNAGVWMYADDDEGAIEAGKKLYHTGVDADGYLEVTGTAGNMFVGIAAIYNADQGSTDTPIKVLLV